MQGPKGDGQAPADDVAEITVLELIRRVAGDAANLARQEVDLARRELIQALRARALAAGALAAAGVLGLIAVLFVGMASASALDSVLRPWASRIVVALAFLAMAGGAALFAMAKLKSPPLRPEETARTIKEDVEWAKARLTK